MKKQNGLMSTADIFHVSLRESPCQIGMGIFLYSFNEAIEEDEKAERFDVNCKIDDGSQINLEMQASRIVEDLDGPVGSNPIDQYLPQVHP